MLNTKIVTLSLALWAAVMFLTCITFGLVTPHSLHMHKFLEQILPGFEWLTWSGFLLGLSESFLYGAYAGLVFCLLSNGLNQRFK